MKEEVTKPHLLHKVDEAVKLAMKEGADVFMLYYSGHGDLDTGGWICSLEEMCIDIEDAYVTIEEVLDIFQRHKFDGMLEVTSDSCYSGKIAFRAKAYWETHDDLYLKGLKIIASTSRFK